MPNTILPRLRQFLALATDNWLARGYLAVVAASVVAMFLFPDSTFAESPLLLTAPLSCLGVLLPFGLATDNDGGGGAVESLAIACFVVWLLVCALVNAAVLGALAARSASTASPGGGEEERESDAVAVSASPRLQRMRALLAPAVDNWLARGYLAVVAAAVGFFLYACYVLPDPGFAGIWPLMATAPLSIIALLLATPTEFTSLTWLNPLIFSIGTVLAGLFNAALLGRFAHRVGATREPRATG